MNSTYTNSIHASDGAVPSKPRRPTRVSSLCMSNSFKPSRDGRVDGVARLARELLAGSPGRRERRCERKAHGNAPGPANRDERLPQGHALDERGVGARVSLVAA